MKPIFLPAFLLIMFPLTFTNASTTETSKELELGSDIPESQFLTNDEMAKYETFLITHKIFKVTKQFTWKTTLIPNGLHAYMTSNIRLTEAEFEELSKHFIKSTLDTCSSLGAKAYPQEQRLELYFNPNYIRATLLEEQKPRCLIL